MSKNILFAVALAALSITALSGAALAQSNTSTDSKAGMKPSSASGQTTDQMKMDKSKMDRTGAADNAATTDKASTDSMKSETEKGIVEASSATMAVRFITLPSAHMTTSKLVGVDVYNNQNESIGEIKDLVLENGRTLTGVIISVGGVLGIGESYVVIEPSSVVVAKKDNEWRAYIDTSKDNLKNAPKFKYEKSST